MVSVAMANSMIDVGFTRKKSVHILIINQKHSHLVKLRIEHW